MACGLLHTWTCRPPAGTSLAWKQGDTKSLLQGGLSASWSRGLVPDVYWGPRLSSEKLSSVTASA